MSKAWRVNETRLKLTIRTKGDFRFYFVSNVTVMVYYKGQSMLLEAWHEKNKSQFNEFVRVVKARRTLDLSDFYSLTRRHNIIPQAISMSALPKHRSLQKIKVSVV